MLKCLFIKRKLYDYLDNGLSAADNIAVKKHLDICDNCRRRFAQIKNVIDLAAEKNAPKPSAEFWHDFRTDLDKKLNETLVPPLVIEHKVRYRLMPALVYIAVLIFALAISRSFYNEGSSLFRMAQDEELLDEIAVLDELGELGETIEANGNEDIYLLEEAKSHKKQGGVKC